MPSVASEGFITAKDVLNLLLAIPEEGKGSTHLEVPWGPHQKHIITIVPFGISAWRAL